MSIQVCRDPSDAVALYLPQRLYLKSFAKLNISVQLPSNKVHGKSISNWELMEKLRKMIQPDSFSVLKVTKHSSEMIRFDAELESRDKLERVILRLSDRIVQLKEYPDQLKVRVSEAKSDFPSRHDWDSFFRDATDMDEMKPGERPDTIHISNLPIRWFVHETDCDEDPPPSENIFKKVFEKFGSIRQVDVPAADPFRMQMKSTMRGITTPPQDAALYFEGYVQFSEYVSFVRCMDALRGQKILYKKNDIAEWCGIHVQFDKTKHMTDAAVKRRSIVRERLSARKRSKDEEEKVELEKVARKEAKERQKLDRVEREKLEKMKEREERRKKKQLAKLMERDSVDLNKKVAEERGRLMKAQKKIQAIRLIEELFRRIELRPELQRTSGRNEYYLPGERVARARIIDKLKRQQEEVLEAQRNKLESAINGRIVIRSALETKKPKRDSSISSVSSEERGSHHRIKTEKLTTPEREMEYNKATAGMYGMPYGFGYPFGCPPAYGFPAPQSTSMFYPVRGAYIPPPEVYHRRPFRGRARGRGRPRMPFFNGPDASHQYYKYFKKLTEAESRNEHDSRERSRSRSRRRSYSRSRSRSRRRTHSRSRSRSRRSRSRRSRSRSRRTRSRSRRSRSYHSRSRSRSHRRSRSRTKRSRSKSRHHTPSPKQSSPHERPEEATENKLDSPEKAKRRSRSWSSPKDGDKRWSRSPKENN